MGEEMWRVWNEIRGSRDDKAILMMSVFKDLLFLAISDLMDSEEEGGQQWARSLASKLAEMDIELPKEPDFNLINLMAQKLVCEKGITVLCNRVGKS